MHRRRRALPAPRATAAPTRRTGVRLGAKQARSRAGRADRGAVPAPSARPICAQGRHHTRGPASPTLTVCPGGKSHPQNRPAAASAEPDIDSGASVTGSDEGGILPGQQAAILSQRLAAAGHASSSPPEGGAISELENGIPAAAVAVLCCCTRPLKPRDQDFELEV